MKAEIVPVGTEILLGNITDTNSAFLANQLPLLGIDLYFISTVGDNRKRLLDTLKRAWKRSDIIITTGGIGPTQDDITRETISKLVGEELKVDEKLWQELQDLLSRFTGNIPQSNIKQATVIPSAQAISNPVGTAPGWWVEKENHIIIALPGPPDEMKLMWEEAIQPRLQQRLTGAAIVSKTIKTFGIAEASVDELVAPLTKLSNPTLATYINPDGVHLRITVKAKERTEAEQLLSREEREVRDILASYVWGVNDDTLDSVAGKLLRARNLTMATMESFTGGLLSHIIAGSLESPYYFKGGLVAYCDASKEAFGVATSIMKPHSEGNSHLAEAMADAARRNMGADIGIGISGNMNSDGSSGDIFIGLIGDGFKRITTQAFFGNRSRVKQRAAYAALFELRNILIEEAQCT